MGKLFWNVWFWGFLCAVFVDLYLLGEVSRNSRVCVGVVRGESSCVCDDSGGLKEKVVTPILVGDLRQDSDDEDELYVDLSVDVSVSELRRRVEITPSVDFSVRRSYWRDGRYVFEGDFKPATRYEVRFLKGLRGECGGFLGGEVVRTVFTRNLSPRVDFRDDGVYLGGLGPRLISLDCVNVSRLEFSARKIIRGNVGYYLKRKWEGRELGGVVWRWGVDVDFRLNEHFEYGLDLSEMVERNGFGVYLLNVRGVRGDGKESNSSKVVFLSDLGILGEFCARKAVVWVRRLSDRSAVSGAKVSLIGSFNQVVGRGICDEMGLVEISGDFTGEREPFAVVAESGCDANVLEVGKGGVDVGMFEVGGREVAECGYSAFVFTGRGIYRPGERVDFQCYLRSVSDVGVKIPGKFPVDLLVFRPDGKVYKRFVLDLDRYGDVGGGFDLLDSVRTGRYKIALRSPGSEEDLGVAEFLVEDFVPDGLKVDVEVLDPVISGRRVGFAVSAEYLFGAPVACGAVKAYCVFVPEAYESAAYPDYVFGDVRVSGKARRVRLKGARTDSDGKACFSFEVPDDLRCPSGMRADFAVSVYGTDGRAVTGMKSVPVFFPGRRVGIRRFREGVGSVGVAERFEYVVLDASGKKLSSLGLRADIYKLTTRWALRRNGDSYTYVSTVEERHLKGMELDGSGSFSFTPSGGGGYRIVLRGGSGVRSSSMDFECYSRGSECFSKTKPDVLEIIPDKKEYHVGDDVELVVRSPFGGPALLTVSGDTIHESRVFDLKGREGTVRFKVREDFGNGFYCVVRVLRRKDVGLGAGGEDIVAKRADRSFGVVPIKVSRESRMLGVDLDVPGKVEPGGKVSIRCRVSDSSGKGVVGASVTFSLVDRGILNLTNYEVPDPFDFFYGRKALGTRFSDIYSMMVPEFRGVVGEDGVSRPGGGAASRRFLGNIGGARVENVSIWRGDARTDASGEAVIDARLPDFSGNVAVMCVAAVSDSFGSDSREMEVSSPLVVKCGAPRFLAFGDESYVPVTVFNKTGEGREVSVSLEEVFQGAVAGKVLRREVVRRRVTVLAGGSGRVGFSVTAGPGVSRVGLRVVAVSGEYSSRVGVVVPVRPPSPPELESGFGVVRSAVAGKSSVGEFSVPAPWFAGGGAEVAVSAMPSAVGLSGLLKSLEMYPYGCVEQTTSKAFPLLFFKGLEDAVGFEFCEHLAVGFHIKRAVERLESMQCSDGGFSMWPGGGRSYPWGSAYAAHFLTEARRSGFTVEETVLDGVLGYLWKRLERSVGGGDDLSVKAYAVYVLALNGMVSRSWALRLFEERENLDVESRVRVGLALELMKCPLEASKLLRVPIPKALSRREVSGSLRSYISERAALLRGLLELRPDDVRIEELALGLLDDAKCPRELTTRERSCVLIALGKYFKARPPDVGEVEAEVYADGERVGVYRSKDGGTLRIGSVVLGKSVRVVVSGKGSLWYSWRSWGSRRNWRGLKGACVGLRVSRRFLTEGGGAVDLSHVPLGAVVLVELSVDADVAVPNAVVLDMLPGGFEIENPRLSTRMKFDTGAGRFFLVPERVERRDDRLVLFGGIPRGRSIYRYAVRAVSAGRYALPAVYAECMYDPSVRSVGVGGEVVVVGSGAGGVK
jgi:uncharacterized protein YfaS (alpha-2-macroglobulin family)